MLNEYEVVHVNQNVYINPKNLLTDEPDIELIIGLTYLYDHLWIKTTSYFVRVVVLARDFHKSHLSINKTLLHKTQTNPNEWPQKINVTCKTNQWL